MDRYSILDPSAALSSSKITPSFNPKNDSATQQAGTTELGTSGGDNGQSLAQMAERDLEAALQLLAERALYITGASGAAIGLRQGGEMICRSSAGPSAPQLGAQLQLNSGLTGESVRTRRVLRCDDAEIDSRVNRDSCRALGIKSVMVMPLLQEQEAIGVFELLADRTQAFEERDVIALERLAEVVLTAVGHAEAAKRALKEIGEAKHLQDEDEPQFALSPAVRNQNLLSAALPDPVVKEAVEADLELHATEFEIRECTGCGFPVSEGRTLCLDCEAARDAESAPPMTPSFLSQNAASKAQRSWLHSHFYTVAAVVVAALTVAMLIVKLR